MPSSSDSRGETVGFTLIELLVVIAIIAILASMLVPALSRAKDRAQSAIDFNNTRQLMIAAHLYAADADDHLPHPTWGGNGTGHDGWAYGTELMSRSAGPTTPERLETQLASQIEAFKSGQLASYVSNTEMILVCPKDATEFAGSKRDLYLQRPVKITSYDWNGTIGGYLTAYAGRGSPLPNGQTFKVSALRPSGILQWEKDELIPFYFNDAGNHPGEGISQRHGGGEARKAQVDVKGGASVGLLDGGARKIGYAEYYRMAGSPGGGLPPGSTIQRTVPAPNNLYFDPRDPLRGAPRRLPLDPRRMPLRQSTPVRTVPWK